MKCAVIAITFFFLAHTSCIAGTHPSEITRAKAPIQIGFDGANNLIVINATINGKGPFRFALDTGSSVHVLNREIAERLALRIIGPTIADSGNKTTPAEVTEISELRVGELILRNQRIFVTPFPESYPFDGFLGADLLKQFVVTIDFALSVLTLTPPLQFSAPHSSELVPLKLRDGLIPEIKAEIDGHTGWLKIDTGYNGSLALFAEFVAQHKSFADSDKYPSTSAAGGQTISGSAGITRLIQIRLLKFKSVSRVSHGTGGEVMLNKVPAALFIGKSGSNSTYAGAIGTLVLHRFKVTFNYFQRVMILEQ